jgi:hypothetical protein
MPCEHRVLGSRNNRKHREHRCGALRGLEVGRVAESGDAAQVDAIPILAALHVNGTGSAKLEHVLVLCLVVDAAGVRGDGNRVAGFQVGEDETEHLATLGQFEETAGLHLIVGHLLAPLLTKHTIDGYKYNCKHKIEKFARKHKNNLRRKDTIV